MGHPPLPHRRQLRTQGERPGEGARGARSQALGQYVLQRARVAEGEDRLAGRGQYAGIRPPTREGTAASSGPPIRSRRTTSVPSSTAGPGQAQDHGPLAARYGNRFVTGAPGGADLGPGHVVLPAPETEATLDFYEHLLGFQLRDSMRLPPVAVPTGAPGKDVHWMHFLSPNRRHHTLGPYPGALPPGIVHFMVERLYASGNCSAAVMGETCPGPGTTIGPAMAFGWAAVNAIAAEVR
ncbi:VOC family protein [Streptomyces sp. NPDC002138]|uniref:VOC family protein n=1 Tax=Streptomyces sp. NPDC002138 TaxID=3154410 RepID=UPI003325A349